MQSHLDSASMAFASLDAEHQRYLDAGLDEASI